MAKHVNAYLSDENVKKLERIASRMRRSLSGAISIIIEDYEEGE